MKRIMLGFMATCLFLLPALSQARSLRLVLKDRSIVEGELLGVDEGVATLKAEDGKSLDVPLRKVKKAFDAETGKAVKLASLQGQALATASKAKPAVDEVEPASKASASAAADADSEEAADEASAKSPRLHHGRAARKAKLAAADQSDALRSYNKRKTTAEILDWTGIGVFMVGCLVMGVGASEMNDATRTHYTGPNNNAGAYYRIDGQDGYYTADQVSEYEDGQTTAVVGCVVMVGGVITGTVGLCIKPKAMPQDALLNVSDGKLALGMPKIDLNRHMDGAHAMLLHAAF
jgi:hypothetical protein